MAQSHCRKQNPFCRQTKLFRERKEPARVLANARRKKSILLIDGSGQPNRKCSRSNVSRKKSARQSTARFFAETPPGNTRIHLLARRTEIRQRKNSACHRGDPHKQQHQRCVQPLARKSNCRRSRAMVRLDSPPVLQLRSPNIWINIPRWNNCLYSILQKKLYI